MIVEILGRASRVLAEEAACDGDAVLVDDDLTALGHLIGERLRRLNRGGIALRGDRRLQVVQLEVMRPPA